MTAYSANFGTVKGGLTTVKRLWLGHDKASIGAWGGTLIELQANTGQYGLNESPASNARWLVFKTGEDEDERYLVLPLAINFHAFNFGIDHTGKTIAYIYLNSSGADIGTETSVGVTEYPVGSGIYIVGSLTYPTNAVWVRARTVETPSTYVSGSLEVATTVNTVSSAATKNLVLREFLFDYVTAIITTLNDYNRNVEKNLRLNVNRISDDDSIEVGKFPTIGVESAGHTEIAMSLGKDYRKYLLTCRANIWYYQEVLSTAEKKKEIYKALSSISSIIRANPKLGGFGHDTRIMASTIRPRVKGDGTLVSGGVVIIETDKVIRQNLV